MSQKLSYRMLQIGNAPAGMLGLNELFEEFFTAGISPDNPDLAVMLLDSVRENNFIPKTAITDYESALVQAYQEFYAEKSGDENYKVKSYGTWRGYPREQISWFPTIAVELCDGCERCINFCSYGVFQKKGERGIEVVEPFFCKVGCSSCAAVCKPDAILFPPREMLNDYRPIG